jgi:hypothetical protein
MFTRHDFPASFFYFLNTRNNRGGVQLSLSQTKTLFCCNLSGIKTPPNKRMPLQIIVLWEGGELHNMHAYPFHFLSSLGTNFRLFSFLSSFISKLIMLLTRRGHCQRTGREQSAKLDPLLLLLCIITSVRLASRAASWICSGLSATKLLHENFTTSFILLKLRLGGNQVEKIALVISNNFFYQSLI